MNPFFTAMGCPGSRSGSSVSQLGRCGEQGSSYHLLAGICLFCFPPRRLTFGRADSWEPRVDVAAVAGQLSVTVSALPSSKVF